MKRERSIAGIVLLCCVVASGTSRVVAVPTPSGTLPDRSITDLAVPLALQTDQELTAAKYSYYRIPVHNVRPGLMAWWLDAAHNQEPEEIAQSRHNLDEAKGGYGLSLWEQQQSAAPKYLTQSQLPAGVDFVMPLESQHTLLVNATEAGAHQVQTLMQALDKPLRQIEVSVKIVEMSHANALNIGVAWPDLQSPKSGSNQTVTVMQRNYSELLENLMIHHQAKVLGDGRLTSINKLAGGLTVWEFTTPTIDKMTPFKELQMQLIPTKAGPANNLYVCYQQRFTVVPTINADETIDLRCIPCLGVALTTDHSSGLLPLKATQWLDVSFTAKDNETVAIAGLHKPLPANEILRYTMAETVPEIGILAATTERIVFVTPRIVHRAEEQPNKAATQLQITQPKPVQP